MFQIISVRKLGQTDPLSVWIDLCHDAWTNSGRGRRAHTAKSEFGRRRHAN